MNHIYFFVAGPAVIIAATLISLRREHIRVEYSVSWLGLGLILLLSSIFPNFLTSLSARAGLDPQVAFIVLAGSLALALLFEVSLVVSRLRDENVQMAQRLAILEYQLQRNQPTYVVEAK